ncbi:DUF2192 domain-containing protein [Fervidicoccus fontis]|uniref:DUF2192 domain-containing protein n=1 Tax=Fervidicoccus fontis TaxID=683846 RepID=A0A843A7S8_9CREN|nr:DUF2192 domain-containing protein [Fervidicoccus fontis]MBE9390745.1 DUF2192 domain-containing protein [Fervidicoccus fontis]
MERGKKVYRKKVSVAIDVLSEALERGEISREEMAELLRKKYRENKISPFRGIALPSDIYDKELATLYVIGKYGMGVMYDYPEFFESVFSKEMEYERAIEVLSSDASDEEKRKIVSGIFGGIPSSNDVARMLRIAFTKVIFGFAEEKELLDLFSAIKRALPECEKDVSNFARFYIGFKIAEKITIGEIKSRVEKEATKQAMNLSVNLGMNMPDDKYIYVIARKVFKVPEEILERVLSVKERGGKGEERNEAHEEGSE